MANWKLHTPVPFDIRESLRHQGESVIAAGNHGVRQDAANDAQLVRRSWDRASRRQHMLVSCVALQMLLDGDSDSLSALQPKMSSAGPPNRMRQARPAPRWRRSYRDRRSAM